MALRILNVCVPGAWKRIGRRTFVAGMLFYFNTTTAIRALVSAVINGIRLRQYGQTWKKFSPEGK